MRKCKTCGSSLEGRYRQTKFCNRLCFRRSPENKIKYSDRTKAYQKAHATEIPRRYQKLKYLCNHKSYAFGLTQAEYTMLLGSGCTYCGSGLLDETGSGLDRKDCNNGYTPDNVLPCCGSCNQIRNVHLTVNEMRIAMAAVLAFRRNKTA